MGMTLGSDFGLDQDKTLACRTFGTPTPLCWTYGPTAGTRINPCVLVLPLASTIQGEGSRSILLVGAGPPDQDTDNHHDISPVRRGGATQGSVGAHAPTEKKQKSTCYY